MIPALVLLLFFCPWGNDLYALPKAAAVCVAVLIFFCCNSQVARPTDTRPWYYVATALMLSTMFSWDPGYSLVSIEHSRGLGLLQWAICGLLFFCGLNIARKEIDRAVLYGGGLMAVAAIWQRLILPGSRASWGSTQGGPVIVGEMLVVCFPTAWRLHPAFAILFVAVAFVTHCRSASIAMGVLAVYLWRIRA